MNGPFNQEGTSEVDELLGEDIFSFPKPSALIQYFISFVINEKESSDFIVLDLFGGSGTTAQAVLDINKQDGGNRKFILVQLPEPCDQESATAKAGFKTIADIAKERVRRVIKKLNDEDGRKLALENKGKQDRGFRVYKLSESNFKTWDSQIAHEAPALQKQMELHIQHILKGRKTDDILYEILLKSGFSLTTQVEKLKLAGKTVFSVANGALLVCLEKGLSMELIRAMAEKKPERVVCLDEGFAGNDQLKANAVQIFKSKGVASFKTV